MNVEELREICLSKEEVTESFPFDQSTLVFKVAGKMFALTGLERKPPAVNLKCDPEKAIEYRAHYHAVQPGYHMNKVHWNTVELAGDVPDELLKQMIEDSYHLVRPKKKGKK